MSCKHSVPFSGTACSGTIKVTPPTYQCVFCELERLRGQVAEIVVALDEALGLADVPERDQDEQWYERRKALGELCNRHEAACPPDALAAARSGS